METLNKTVLLGVAGVGAYLSLTGKYLPYSLAILYVPLFILAWPQVNRLWKFGQGRGSYVQAGILVLLLVLLVKVFAVGPFEVLFWMLLPLVFVIWVGLTLLFGSGMAIFRNPILRYAYLAFLAVLAYGLWRWFG